MVLVVSQVPLGDVGLCCCRVEEAFPAALALFSIWVHPSARGRGVLDAALSRADELAAESRCDRLVLWVKSDNAHAIAAYERLGFTDCGVEPDGHDSAGERRFERPLTGPRTRS